MMHSSPELTILMPCLNEARSLPFCICEAQTFLAQSGISGEILVSDNGSTDGSQRIAEAAGARVISVSERGYGAALRAGIQSAYGTYVIMADSDGSYDFGHLMPFLEALRQGASLVVGDRYANGFAPGASPWIHRCVGIPFLSWLGRLAQRRYHVPKDALVHDFHCGLRGVRREDFLRLGTSADGMEFASEMILLASAAGQRIVQVPAGLRTDRRGGKASHLRAVPDGIRHIKLIRRHLFHGNT